MRKPLAYIMSVTERSSVAHQRDPAKHVVLFVTSTGLDFRAALGILEIAFKERQRRNPDAQLITIGGSWPHRWRHSTQSQANHRAAVAAVLALLVLRTYGTTNT